MGEQKNRDKREQKVKTENQTDAKMVKKKSHKKIIAICAGSIVAVLLVGYAAVGYYYRDKFYPGTVFNGTNCSGKDIAYIRDIVKKKAETYSLSIKERENKTEFIDSAAIKLTYKDDKSLEKIKGKQNSWLWPVQIFGEKEYEVSLENFYDEKSLQAAIEKLQCMQDGNMVAPQDAKIEDNGTTYEIIPEVKGTTLDKSKALAAMKKAVDERKEELVLEDANCYASPTVFKDNENLIKEAEQLNKMTGLQINLNFGDTKEAITREMLQSWLKKNEEGTYSFDEAIVKPVVIGWSEKHNTYGRERDFTTTGGYNVHLTRGDYGWRMWQDKTTEELMAALNECRSGDVDVTWLYAAQKHGGNDINGTYVEISIDAQRMWFYKNGTCIVDTPVVTGNPNRGNGTPRNGVWRLKGKQSPSVLVGRKPDGSIDYETPVTYWMPFNGGVGIHDLSSRSAFGGSIYLSNGSHGCVNTPYNAVQTIYRNIEVGTPVVVY